jgi:hypothetical protein
MSKQDQTRAMLLKLGLDLDFTKAKAYFRETYKAELNDSTFYEVRKKMRVSRDVVQDVRKKLVANKAAKPGLPQQMPTIVSVVKQAQQLIAALGKKDAKDLIDAL